MIVSGRQQRNSTIHIHVSILPHGEGNGDPLQYSCLENPRDGGAWWAAVYGVAQSRTRLNRLAAAAAAFFPMGFCDGSVVMNPPANAGDSGDVSLTSWIGKTFWRRKWQPTPVFLPGKSHGQRSLVGYSPWGLKESDMI